MINLSFAGPDNEALRLAVAALANQDFVLVAAVGNDGPKAPPAYPSAYPGVVGVTAVDESLKLFRRANRGEQVDIAAPGVDLDLASTAKRRRPVSGTSFAAPFVSAALAAAGAGSSQAFDAEGFLARNSRDIGEKGRDRQFGLGLLQIKGC